MSLPRPHRKTQHKSYQQLLDESAKTQSEIASSPRTAIFARLENGPSPQSIEPYELPFDPLNSTLVANRAIFEESQRTDEFTRRVFKNSPEAINTYETFKENPNLVNKSLLKKLKMSLLKKNINARKIQQAFRNYNGKTATEVSFVGKLLSLFTNTRGNGYRSRKSKRK